MHLSGWRVIRVIPSRCSTVQASSIRTTRTFRLDLPLCREASNCSSLHPSRCLSSTSGHRSVFNQLWDFIPKHIYGKTAATVSMMWIPVLTRSFIGQVVHSKFNFPDDSIHDPDAQASYMEITCIRLTVQTTAVMVRTRQALIWKLRTAKVRLSGRWGNTVRTRLYLGNNFCKIWKADSRVVRLDALCLPSERCLGISSQMLIWTCSL
jgi:hypothetical protein